MPAYGPEPETHGAGRQIALAAGVMLLALSTLYLSSGAQQRVALSFQATVLRPFIATQARLAGTRIRAEQIDYLQAELDSLTAATSTRSALVGENRTLRELLGLVERAEPGYLPASVLRPGTPGSESMFLVDVGAEDGVQAGSPVVSARGLVGVIREVRPRNAVGMDWTHPEFRVSAMLADGTTYGIVENVRGAFREDDRLMLNGTAYHQLVPKGTAVVTSGLGGVFPRGIPVGKIDATAEVQGNWRKSYWLRPLVEPGSVTHVLVATVGAPADVSRMWRADSVAAAGADSARGPGL